MALWARGSILKHGFSEVSPRYKLLGPGKIHRSPCAPRGPLGTLVHPPASLSCPLPLLPSPPSCTSLALPRLRFPRALPLPGCPALWLGGPHPPRRSRGRPLHSPSHMQGLRAPLKPSCTPTVPALSSPRPIGVAAAWLVLAFSQHVPPGRLAQAGRWPRAACIPGGRGLCTCGAPGSSASSRLRTPAWRLCPAGIRRQPPGLHPAGRARTWSAPAPESVTYFYLKKNQ